MGKKKAIYYLNQFFGGIGGEEEAYTSPLFREGAVGPGLALQKAFGEDISISGTIICGDNYFNENIESAKEEILQLIRKYDPDIFIAGPAFNAGRYGIACATLCLEIFEQDMIPVITGMYVENPGVEMCKKSIYIIETGKSAAQMKKVIPQLAKLAQKLLYGQSIGSPAEEGYIPRGIRRNVFHEKRGSTRAVETLLKKINAEVFSTEYAMPVFDRVRPGPALKNISSAKIAILTSGGIVPKGNPDHIESSSASKYGKYPINDTSELSPDQYETIHGGYDPTYANQDADRVLPLDVLRDLEKQGNIGSLYDYFFSTVGNGTSVANAKKYAHDIALQLKESKVDAVILTST